MKGLLALALVCVAAVSTTEAVVKCRRCIGASLLDDCTFSIPCSPGEICYMDEVITQQLRIEYNGGCRANDVCNHGSVGKRAGGYTACSACCNETRSPECNTKLCGIRSANSNANQCYHCASESAGGAGVSDPNHCTTLVSCQSDQMCGAETFKLSTRSTYEFKCIQKSICSLITREALKQKKRCEADPSMCALGKRDSSGYKVCTACCGDPQCNSMSCEDILERLYNLWKAGVLDLDTLKQNGTLPATTTSSSG